ncbi:MAG: MFS transporter [Gammaproteobacteria bacterium]|nr:MFS transporter [Gammaproteobacteria bacterium]
MFWVIAAYGTIAAVGFRLFVPESVPRRGESGFSMQTLLRNKAELLSDRRFLGYLLCMLFIACGLFAFVSLSPFLLMEHMGVRKDHFGYLYGLAITGFIVGTILSGRLHGRVPGRRLVGIGLAIIGAHVMFALAAAGVMRPAALIAPHFVYLIGMGLLMPQSVVAALGPVPHIAATATALMGFLQVTCSATLVTLLGFFQEGGQVLVAFTMCVVSLGALLAYSALVLGPRPPPRGSAPPPTVGSVP